ncbi:MAG: hypothetical protein AB7F89_14000 [Pirellulaceae bacterium]
MTAPTVVARDADALRRVAQLLPRAFPLVGHYPMSGSVRIEPGTVYGGDRFFVSLEGGWAVFTSGRTLYRQPEGDFVRDNLLIAFGQGAQRAAWLVPLAHAEMTFLMALAGTLAGPIGTTAAITVGLAHLAEFYTHNKPKVDRAVRYLRPTLASLTAFATRCPQLFWLLCKGLAPRLGRAALQGITASDVAYFLGKLLGGIGAAPELSLRGLLSAAAMASSLTVVLRGPGMVGHGALAQAQNLVQQLQAAGISVTDQEAMTVVTAQCLRQPENQRALDELIRNASEAAPLIESLSKVLRTSV